MFVCVEVMHRRGLSALFYCTPSGGSESRVRGHKGERNKTRKGQGLVTCRGEIRGAWVYLLLLRVQQHSALSVCESVNKVSVFAHTDSSVTADGVFVFNILAK